MLFNSIQFLIFFPIVTVAYFIIPHKFRYLWLLLSSYYFYMCWNPRYALLMLFSTAVTYVSGLMISMPVRAEKQEHWRRFWVAGSFILNLSVLFFFKYFNFAFDFLERMLSVAGIRFIEQPFSLVLPVGISFYTFQALSYTMDVYRKEIEPERNFFRYALFVSFFPQLVAGPIERSKNLLEQLREKQHFEYERMRQGLLTMVWGFFLKMVISDRIALLVDTVYDNYWIYSGFEIALASILFAFQIYTDFQGYSCIAIGSAEVMGFRLMENFDTPYFSMSVAEFWRRWHISLSTWFRDYLYIPLGGNRKGNIRKYLNIMVVFLLSGLWHGASWHFVIWGGINGAYQIIGELTKKVRLHIGRVLGVNEKRFSCRLARTIGTFLLVDLSWIFFRANGTITALRIIKRMFLTFNPWIFFDGGIYRLGLDQKDLSVLTVSLLCLFVASLCKYNKISLRQKITEQGLWLRWSIYICAILVIVVFGIYGSGYDAAQFIYFQF